MKFFKKRNKALKYIERLALENVENKKRIEALESQLTQFTQLGVQMAEQIKELKSCGNIDERLNSLESDMLTRDDVEDIVNDTIPSNLEDVCGTYEEYDFSEFITMSDMEDELRHSEYITQDEMEHEVERYMNDIKDDFVGDMLKEVKEIQTPKWDDPEQFMLFLNKLAKYVASQTENNN